MKKSGNGKNSREGSSLARAALMNRIMSSVLWKFHVTHAWWVTVP